MSTPFTFNTGQPTAPKPDTSLSAIWARSLDVVTNHYADFGGTATMRQFWEFWTAKLIVVVALLIVVAPLGVIVALGLFIPVTALGARRLREAGFSPWWLLLQLIPILGFVVALIMLAQPAKVNAVELGSTAPVNVDNFGF